MRSFARRALPLLLAVWIALPAPPAVAAAACAGPDAPPACCCSGVSLASGGMGASAGMGRGSCCSVAPKPAPRHDSEAAGSQTHKPVATIDRSTLPAATLVPAHAAANRILETRCVSPPDDLHLRNSIFLI